MSHKQTDLDPVEQALLELDSAATAGVFCRTNVDGRSLPGDRVFRSARATAIRLACTAAAVALAVGLWTWVPRTNPSGVPREGSGTLAQASATLGDGFRGCFGGPTEAISSPCRAHDYDADGDVDLADFGTYQLTYAGASY